MRSKNKVRYCALSDNNNRYTCIDITCDNFATFIAHARKHAAGIVVPKWTGRVGTFETQCAPCMVDAYKNEAGITMLRVVLYAGNGDPIIDGGTFSVPISYFENQLITYRPDVGIRFLINVK